MRRLLALSFIIACGAAGMPAATGAATPHEYVRNGSFEAGTSGWSPGANTPIDTLDGGSFDGAHHLRITLSEPAFTVRQRIDGALGDGSFTLSLNVRSATPVRVVAQLEFLSQPDATLRAELAATSPFWAELNAAGAIPAASEAVLTIVGSGRAGDTVEIDDVSLVGPPSGAITPTPSVTPPPTSTHPPSDAISTTPTPAAGVQSLVEGIAPSLRNPGFEDLRADGSLASWDTYGGDGTSTDSPVHSGGRSARLTSATESTKWLYQPVLVSGGQGYAFEAWIWHDDPAVASAFLRVSWYASSDGTGTAISTADSTTRLDASERTWPRLTTGSITAPPDARSANVRVMLDPLSAAPAAIHVDDAWFGPAAPGTVPDGPDATVSENGASGSTALSRSARAPQSASRRSAQNTSRSLAAGAPARDGARVIINEVLYDPTGDETAGEWVELYNAGTVPASLAGWELRDGASSDLLPPFTLDPGEFVVVGAAGGDAASLGVPHVGVPGRIGNGLGNDGDALVLIDGTGVVQDALSWGDNAFIHSPPVIDVPQGYSIERMPAGAFTFDENPAPSPGRESLGQPHIRPRAGDVEILPAPPRARYAWALWAVAAAAGAALATAIVWRGYEAWRGRAPNA